MLLISGELIVGRYVAESVTTDCRTFWTSKTLSTAYRLHTVDKGLYIGPEHPAIS